MEENKIEGDEMAKIGDILKQPEPNWKRYDDTNTLIEYDENWSKYPAVTEYDGSSIGALKGKNSSFKFQFRGTKLRLIVACSDTRYYSNKISVSIDDLPIEYFDANTVANTFQVLKYEKLNLENKNHIVKVTVVNSAATAATFDYRFDALDIDENGTLLPVNYKEKHLVSLYKKQSGEIFIEDFNSINPEWIISPSDSFSIAARKGFMRLNHTADKDVLLLIDKPQGDIAIQVIADYTPDVEGDKGGLIIYQNADNKVEFLESHSITSSKEHKEWLATSTGEHWDFYSKVDSTFDYADSDKLEATKIGVVLKKGVSDSYEPLDIDRILITSGHKLKLRQLFPNNKVILKDENGTKISINQVSKSNTGIDINLPSLEFQGSIEVYDEQNNLIAGKKALFYGGDIYNMGSPIKILMDSKDLNDTDPTDLGYMIEGKRMIKMIVQNENSIAVQNLKISIEQYMEKVGYTWADVSLDKSTWADQITIGTLGANSDKEFWVLVTKDLNYMGLEPILFNIKLQHD
ncbi:cell adhesion protein [Bacillus sp. PGP15]|uniref:cell adhesion protein n=1 Tax=Bacillus TaxID=1386 RepID=UPI0020006EDE|nr:cell adhesion protein [Bacillus sp. PGP15]UPL46413.1 cell adhesion protein [Bacillus sp. PGP15]